MLLMGTQLFLFLDVGKHSSLFFSESVTMQKSFITITGISLSL
jgi:hypothetical protein